MCFPNAKKTCCSCLLVGFVGLLALFGSTLVSFFLTNNALDLLWDTAECEGECDRRAVTA